MVGMVQESKRVGIGDSEYRYSFEEYSLNRMRGCILSSCLFNLYIAEYIMRNAGLDEAQAGIKIAGRNIKNLRYADDTTLVAESELQPLLMKVKESEKVGLKLNIQTTKIMANRWGNNGNSEILYFFFWLQNHCR